MGYYSKQYLNYAQRYEKERLTLVIQGAKHVLFYITLHFTLTVSKH